MATCLKEFTEGKEKFAATAMSAAKAAMWKECVPLLDAWKSAAMQTADSVQKCDQLMSEGVKADDPRLVAAGESAFEQVAHLRESRGLSGAKLDAIIKFDADRTVEEIEQALSSASFSTTVMIVAILVTTLIMIVLGVLLSKSISSVLRKLIGEAERLSEAAVGGKLQTRGNPELVSLEFRPDRRGRQRHARRGDRAVERGGRVRGPDLQGRHPGEDHRQLQRRLQRDQEQPEPVHRRGQRAGGRRRHAVARRPWKASWPPAPTPPSTRATSARSSGRERDARSRWSGTSMPCRPRP